MTRESNDRQIQDECLRIIVNHPGDVGWLQIDRMLVSAGIIPNGLMNVLNGLVADGLVEADGDPKLSATHYAPTDEGRRIFDVRGGDRPLPT